MLTNRRGLYPQEVTPNIRAILEDAPWWHLYSFSPEPDDMEYYTMLGCRSLIISTASTCPDTAPMTGITGSPLREELGKVSILQRHERTCLLC